MTSFSPLGELMIHFNDSMDNSRGTSFTLHGLQVPCNDLDSSPSMSGGVVAVAPQSILETHRTDGLVQQEKTGKSIDDPPISALDARGIRDESFMVFDSVSNDSSNNSVEKKTIKPEVLNLETKVQSTSDGRDKESERFVASVNSTEQGIDVLDSNKIEGFVASASNAKTRTAEPIFQLGESRWRALPTVLLGPGGRGIGSEKNIRNGAVGVKDLKQTTRV